MKRTRQVLVMTLVATALCADRMVAADPEVRASLTSPSADPIARLATNLGRRFSGSFRRVSTTCVRLHQERRDERPAAAPRPQPPVPTVAVASVTQGTPFQFRLPPPSL